MTTSQQCLMLEAKLDAWAKERGGFAKRLGNMNQLWREAIELATRPDGAPCVLFACSGEKPVNFPDGYLLHRVNRRWSVIIMRSHGWKKALQDEGEQGEAAFDDVLEDLRDNQLRTAIFLCEADELIPTYGGWNPVPNPAPQYGNGNPFLDAAMLEISGGNDIPGIQRTT